MNWETLLDVVCGSNLDSELLKHGLFIPYFVVDFEKVRGLKINQPIRAKKNNELCLTDK